MAVTEIIEILSGDSVQIDNTEEIENQELLEGDVTQEPYQAVFSQQSDMDNYLIQFRDDSGEKYQLTESYHRENRVYDEKNPVETDTVSIIWKAAEAVNNVESRGRVFRVEKADGSGTYHSVDVLYAFISYKLDPEIQRKMPGIDITFRPDDKSTAFEMINHYRKKGLESFDAEEGFTGY